MWDEARERIEALSAARDADAEVAVMAGADPRLWLAIDGDVRRAVPVGWHRSVVLRALGRDGRLREAALTRLDARIALPVLAIRAADWVPQVRERARREYLRHLFRDPMTALDLFPLACRLRDRGWGEWLAATLEGMLRQPEVRSAALAAHDVPTRRTAYASGYATAGELKAGLRDGDLKIRLGCARAPAGTADPEVLRLLRTSGTAALRALAIHDHASAVEALADPASLVRAHAQLALRRAGEDPASRYRALLTSVDARAVGYLAEDPRAAADPGVAGTESHSAPSDCHAPPPRAPGADPGAAGTSAAHHSTPDPASDCHAPHPPAVVPTPGAAWAPASADGSGSAGCLVSYLRAPGAAGTPAAHHSPPGAASGRHAPPAGVALEQAPARLPGAIAGLAETGGEADAALLLPFLADGRAKVRAEAVRALRRLRALSLDRAVPLLTDPSPRVARQVMLSLRDSAALIDETTLSGMLAPGQPGHRRRIAFQLLSARDTWTRLALDLRLLLDPDEPLRDTAANDLRNWLAYGSATTYTAPRGTRAAELRDLLSRAEPLLAAADARVLRLFL